MRSLKKLSYGVQKLGFIREALFGYTGFSALMRELIQNADDAKSEEVVFRFLSECLIVENQSRFSDEDFDKITQIASGNKRADAESTGTFGVGFVSVYQLTDYPELFSSGYFLKLDPKQDSADLEPSVEAIDGTRFRFAYRRAETEICREIEQQPITIEDQKRFLELAQDESCRNLIFLRNIKRIRIYDGEELVCETMREKHPHAEGIFDLTLRQRCGERERQIEFRLYERDFSSQHELEGKKSIVALAYPLDPSTTDIPQGLLYNFLPTHLQTGFGFLMNGDFYPTNDRRSILYDESRSDTKSHWNQTVIAQAAKLLISTIDDLKSVFTPRQFYAFMPLQPNPNLTLLAEMKDRFMEYARGTSYEKPRIVYSSQNRWCTADEVKLISDPKLVKLLIEAGESLVPDAFKEHWNFFDD